MSLSHASRARRAVVLALTVPGLMAGLMAGLVAGSSAAAPSPTPVRADPGVEEVAPTSYGPLFGWAQNTRSRPDHRDFYVQRGGQPRIKVNARRTQGLTGAILATNVIYLQKSPGKKPLLYSYDLRTRTRTLLPATVNSATYQSRPITIVGKVSVDGAWLLYQGRVPVEDEYPLDAVVLYNRVSRKIKVLEAQMTDWTSVRAGQVNGRYATFTRVQYDSNSTAIVRYDIKTGRYAELASDIGGAVQQHDPAVSSDGTLYFWRADTTTPQTPGTPTVYTHELVRQPIGGTPAVIASVVDSPQGPSRTFVKDRPDGSEFVFYEWDGDLYRVLDHP